MSATKYRTNEGLKYQGVLSSEQLESHRVFCLRSGNSKSNLIESEVAFRGLNYERLGRRTLIVETNGGRLIFHALNGPSSSNAGRILCDDKAMSRRLLQGAGLNVARSQLFGASELTEAEGFSGKIGFPVTIKPVSSARGKGVFSGLVDTEQLRAAWRGLRELYGFKGPRGILVEKHFVGDDYRLFVVDGKVVSVTKRARANVTGDGVASIRELIDRKNDLRINNPYLSGHPIPTEEVILDRLSQDGRCLSDVPKKGEVVVLRSASNLSAGGDSIDYTDTAHPDYLRIAIRAQKAIPGMAYLGVDIMTNDITQPVKSGDSYIVGEVEFSPAILSVFPLEGEPRNMAGAVLDYYLSQSDTGRSLHGHQDDQVLVRVRLNEGYGNVFNAGSDPVGAEDVCVRLIVYGHVTSVGYRRWLQRQAKAMGVDGWVRNRSDNSVEAVLCGNSSKVGEMMVLCKSGPKRAQVEKISVMDGGKRVSSGFKRRPLKRLKVTGRLRSVMRKILLTFSEVKS